MAVLSLVLFWHAKRTYQQQCFSKRHETLNTRLRSAREFPVPHGTILPFGGGGWDAHRIFNLTVLLTRWAVAKGHYRSSDGWHGRWCSRKAASLTIEMRCLHAGVEQLFNVEVGLPGVHAALVQCRSRPLRRFSSRISAPPGRGARGGCCPARTAAEVGVQLQKPQLVGKGRLRHAQSLGGFGLRCPTAPSHPLSPAPPAQRGSGLRALMFSSRLQRGGGAIVVITRRCGIVFSFSKAAGTEPPLLRLPFQKRNIRHLATEMGYEQLSLPMPWPAQPAPAR